MRIRFHKILPDGRSVRYEKDKDENGEVMDLNIIVYKEPKSKNKDNQPF